MIKKTIIKIIFFLLISTFNSSALIQVDITRGNLNPLPIAVSPLFSDNDSLEKLSKELKGIDVGNEISKIIEIDLKRNEYIL